MTQSQTTGPVGMPELHVGTWVLYSPSEPCKEARYFPAQVEQVYAHGSSGSLRVYLGGGPARLVPGVFWGGTPGLKKTQCGNGHWIQNPEEVRRQEWETQAQARIEVLEAELQALVMAVGKPARARG